MLADRRLREVTAAPELLWRIASLPHFMRLLAKITATGHSCTISVANDRGVLTRTPTGWAIASCAVDPEKLVSDAAAHLDRVGPTICWNAATERLECFAHPLGRGTFYFARDGASTFIATHLVDLVALTHRTTINARSVACYFASRRRTSWDTSTFFSDIERIPPGCVLRVSGPTQEIASYWRLVDDPSWEQLDVARAGTLLHEAIDNELRVATKHRAVAALVSGGIDSSVVASMTCRVAPETTLVCIRGPIVSTEETALQEELLRSLRRPTILYDAIPRVSLDRLRQRNRDAPVPAGGLFTNLYAELLALLADRDIDILIGGEGGDELFSPHPDIIADLLEERRYGAAFEAAAWFASLRAGRTGWRVFREHGLNALQSVPLAVTQADRLFLQRLLGEFASDVDLAVASYRLDRDAARGSLSRHSFEALCDVRGVPLYEAWSDSGVPAILNPLASVAVVRSMMSLRPHDRVRAGAGAYSKRLLRHIAIPLVPGRVRTAAKIGIPDLVSRMTTAEVGEITDILGAGLLGEIGIRTEAELTDPRNIPGAVGLYWALLLVLTVWYEGVRQWAERPIPTMTPICSTWPPESASSMTQTPM